MVTAATGIDLGRSPEFTGDDDERGIKQTTRIQIFNQGGKPLVDGW